MRLHRKTSMIRHDQKPGTHQAPHHFKPNWRNDLETHAETVREFGKKVAKCAAAIASAEQRHNIDVKIAREFKPSCLS
jgi:hypothetical protein